MPNIKGLQLISDFAEQGLKEALKVNKLGCERFKQKERTLMWIGKGEKEDRKGGKAERKRAKLERKKENKKVIKTVIKMLNNHF